jgi:hypothetical protein
MVENLVGNQYGALVVLEITEDNNTRSKYLVECKICNKTRIATYYRVLDAKDKCTCKFISDKPKASYKRMKAPERLKRILKNMKQRCYNETAINYKYYGANGVKICDEWKDDSSKFFEWALANGYADDLEIDRIDYDQGYSPENCRWTTREVQTMNTHIRSDNKSGIKGVFFSKNRWVAKLGNKVLGRFQTFEEAVECRQQAEQN